MGDIVDSGTINITKQADMLEEAKNAAEQEA